MKSRALLTASFVGLFLFAWGMYRIGRYSIRYAAEVARTECIFDFLGSAIRDGKPKSTILPAKYKGEFDILAHIDTHWNVTCKAASRTEDGTNIDYFVTVSSEKRYGSYFFRTVRRANSWKIGSIWVIHSIKDHPPDIFYAGDPSTAHPAAGVG